MAPDTRHTLSRSLRRACVRWRLPAAAVGLAALSSGLALSQEAPAPVRAALDGNRGPYEVAFTPDGSLALVTEHDEAALAIIDRAAGKVLHHVPTGGQEPTGVAVTPNGDLAVVTNSFSGSVAFIDLKSRKVATLPLPGAPWDVVLSPDGARAYVSVSQLDRIAVVDMTRREVVATIATGRRPRALALTPDGKTLVSANFTAGSASFIDTASLKETAQGPTTAVNLRGVAVYPDGRRVVVTGQRAQNERPTETPIGIWSNQAFIQVPNGPRNTIQNLWLDLMGKDVSDPDGIVLDTDRTRAFITCSGGHSLNVVALSNGVTQAVRGIGAMPKGLSFTPDGKEVWVANLLGNDLAVVDPKSLQVTRRVNLGPTPRKDPHLAGRFLFTTATIVKGEQFSCNSCHPEGGTDGISWKFVHVPDALGKQQDRNVKGLRGHLADTAPFRWTGQEANLTSFVKDEVDGLLQGPKLSDAEVKALGDYLQSLALPPNPFRAPGGGLTDAAQRGKILFDGRAGCAQCHNGPKFGGQRRASVGTTPEGVELDVPHLAGVYDTDPYLHDGTARTLEETFTKRNAQKLHGKAHELSEAELADLIEYVREL
jgi:YVTN family beta-propeller protein